MQLRTFIKDILQNILPSYRVANSNRILLGNIQSAMNTITVKMEQLENANNVISDRVANSNRILFDNVQSAMNTITAKMEQLENANNIISAKMDRFSEMHSGKSNEQQEYDNWFLNNVKNAPPSSYWQYFSTTFKQWDTPYGKLIDEGMHKAEFLYEKTLLEEIKEKNIEGDVVEFGVSKGWRLKHLIDSMKEIRLERNVYGFDSFEGLPKPDEVYDSAFWKESMYAANFDEVKDYLECEKNPHIKLIKGWFSETLNQKEAREIQKIAFARIDCDLYHPAVECLDFLKDRLVDNAILLFDDWQNNLRLGETKAFYEWLPNSGWKFEFLQLNGWIHLFLRARKE